MPEAHLAAAAEVKAMFCKCKCIATLSENQVSGQADIRASEHYAKIKKLDFDWTRLGPYTGLAQMLQENSKQRRDGSGKSCSGWTIGERLWQRDESTGRGRNQRSASRQRHYANDVCQNGGKAGMCMVVILIAGRGHFAVLILVV
jgi:hypothetical protein